MRVGCVLVFALLSAAMSLHAAEGSRISFPGCKWSDTKVSVSAARVAVTGPDGKPLLVFMAEPRNASLENLVIETLVDRIVIDARGVFSDGATKITMNSGSVALARFAGKDAAAVSEFGGKKGGKGLLYFEGRSRSMGHYYRHRSFETKGHRKKYPIVEAIPEDLEELHLRWDITDAKEPIEFFGAECALLADMPELVARAPEKPKLLFHATFDGTTDAKSAKGSPKAVAEKGVSFADGVSGQAVRLTSGAGSVLNYSAAGNLVQDRGAVSLWFKREWPGGGRDAKGNDIWRTLFSNPSPKGGRIGSGQLWFWFLGERLRADQSDDDDAYATWSGKAPTDGWNHIVVSWCEEGVSVYLNGRSARGLGDSDSPIKSALKDPKKVTFDRKEFKTFCVGSLDGGRQFDGLIDELCIFSEPLNANQALALWRREQDVELCGTGLYSVAGMPGEATITAANPSRRDVSKFRYCVCDESDNVVETFGPLRLGQKVKLGINLPAGRYTIRATDGQRLCGSLPCLVMRAENPYELKSAAKRPGVPEGLRLVQELKLDVVPSADRFRSVGKTSIKSLGGVPYLEAGSKRGDRFALRFRLDKSVKLHCFEIDYPDDAVRTTDLIIQRSGNPNGDYTMQVGYMTGGEHLNTGRTLTHRCLYWTHGDDVAIVAMTAREGAPAAISAVRVYAVDGAALPPAVAKEPARAEGWRRSTALYFEDPSIGHEFATDGHDVAEIGELIDRTVATMKFTGQNMLVYPGAWYQGMIGDRYNPRKHAPDFLSAWYSKFDVEGLEFVPTVNMNSMQLKEGVVTRVTMRDGSLHSSPISIHDTGLPNWGGWHDTPPNFNFLHPEVQAHISRCIDALVEQGKSHPSFKGVCLYLTRHGMLWFGDPASGYNDYAVDAFAKAKGLSIPVDRKDPLRGREYAKWLRENAWDAWVQWRCDMVTSFYAGVAQKLAAARHDLKLWMNSFVPSDMYSEGFGNPGYMERANKLHGLDGKALAATIPNLILGQTIVPADYRHHTSFRSEQARASLRDAAETADTWSLFRGAKFPWLNIHDRYWESSIGRSGARGSANTLSCNWFTECPWRVTTLNPGGDSAMRAIVAPLRHGDILGVSKGGFLIGTYGMEEPLARFSQAFRALPAVVFDDVTRVGDVVVRQNVFAGKSWFYVVNTGSAAATAELAVPKGTRDLVTGEIAGPELRLDLAPYELRSYSAPRGRPSLKR